MVTMYSLGYRMLAIQVLRAFLPLVTAGYYFVAATVRRFTRKKSKDPSDLKRGLKPAVSCMILLVIVTYLTEALPLISATLSSNKPSPPQNTVIFTLSSTLFWFATLLGHLDSQLPPAYPFIGSWLIYLVAELVLFSLALGVSQSDGSLFSTVLPMGRLILFSALISTVLAYKHLPERTPKRDEENTPLLDENASSNGLNDTQTTANGTTYGSCSPGDSKSSTKAPDSTTEQDKTTEGKEITMEVIVKDFKMLAPFFWPSRKPHLQLLYVAVSILLLVERVLNIVVPLQIGQITNLLSQGNGVVPWKEISVYIGLRILSSGGVVSVIRRWLWTPLEDYTYYAIVTAAFNKIMNLSCDFHDSKESGKLWHAVRRGHSIKDMVNKICFTLVPMVADLVLAISVLYYMFDAYVALVLATVGVMFMWSTGKIIAKQKVKRRELIDNIGTEHSRLCESTENWPTVSHFNRVPHEQDRYSASVRDYLTSHRGYRLWSYLENTIQNVVLMAGLLTTCFMVAYHVAKGDKEVGSFVMLISYWGQLSGPLQTLVNGFGDAAMDLIDVEDFLTLLRREPTVRDCIGARSLTLDDCDVEFENVGFSYDGKRRILEDVNFRAKSGETIAIVGQTGGGKSTLLKLLFRFYDPTHGVVKIGGQDISKVTLESLREQMGVVPQDPTLFHDTIMNNIRYAKLDATDEEIMEACKAVALHERFLSFADGYNTKVGERGMKLSGGELQRVAIARAIIKNPNIVLLDEATSSVDSETEAQVQASLKHLTTRRTTFVIAHRLSTIVNADRIMVVKEGQIVETGTHAELLEKKGQYHRLWSLQGAMGGAAVLPSQETGNLFDDLDHDIFGDENSCHDSSSSEDPSKQVSKLKTKLSVNTQLSTQTVRHDDATKSNATCQKKWKPDAPEFVPRACPPMNVGFRPPLTPARTNSDVSMSKGLAGDGPKNYASVTGVESGRKAQALGDTKENVSFHTNQSFYLDDRSPTHSRPADGFHNGEQSNSTEKPTPECVTPPYLIECCDSQDLEDVSDDGADKSSASMEPAIHSNNRQGHAPCRKMTMSEPASFGAESEATINEAIEPSSTPSGASQRTGRSKQGPSTANQRRRRRNYKWKHENARRTEGISGTDRTG
ncbi:hypothetical protein AJ80_02593 [Polytolypa hystricis UAMH7299]|uniref:Heavy metal tolerance protein n=1 Tax=Polytolypa hystricis (strain UAMH7299) TaxID=1447883 RepID=A0A2B7YQ89_POLH7|nr:hypothetical protein AJ80_02593 [Polytolypa hystricis UAMH7299]